MSIKNIMTTKPVRFALASFLCLIAAAVAPDSYAQTHYSSNVSIGVKGGMDMSRMFFNPTVRQNFKFGATAGAMIRYVEEDHFGLIAELNFSQRGWKENFEEYPFNYSRTLNYIELPVLAHIYFGRRGRFFFNAGPQISYFLGESTKADFNPEEINSIEGFPIKGRENKQLTMPVEKKFDYGICAGLGGEFNINPRNSISLEVRFYYGLGNIYSSRRTDNFRASNQMSLAATIGYWLRVK